MKGDKKRRKTGFRKGVSPWNKGLKVNRSTVNNPNVSTYKRLTNEEFKLVTRESIDSSTISTPGCHGETGSIRLLRPKKNTSGETGKSMEKEESVGMRLVDTEKLMEMYNDSTSCHSKVSPHCTDPHMTVLREAKWGLCWKFTLQCVKCHFISKEYKLYQEVKTNKPGPNPAAPNLGLGAGLQDNPIGPTSIRRILCSMNVNPPCRSSIQRTTNTVGDQISTLNKEDMSEKLELVQSVSELRGHNKSYINISTDGTYNSSTISSRKKPGQNASVGTAFGIETITNKQYIVAAAVQTKLCWKGAWLRSSGYEVHCPDGHPDCTANLSFVEPLSEFEMGREIGQQLAKKGVFVKFATTDGDGQSAAGIDAAMKVMDPLWNVHRLADPTHLGQVQFREAQKANFSDSCFPGTTRAQKQECQKVFCMDIKARSSLIFKNLMREYNGNINKMKAMLPKAISATVLCYSGDCSSCRRHSVVCDGGVRNNWWYRSIFLASNKITVLNLSENDKKLLTELLTMRLGEDALELLKLNTSMQKNEAAHRSLHVSLPKNVNFSRNTRNRTHSFIHRFNNGIGVSTITKCQHIGVNLSPQVKNTLKQMDREGDYQKQYHKNKHNIARNLKARALKYFQHKKFKELKKPYHGYRKGQLDAKLCGPKNNKKDHNYS